MTSPLDRINETGECVCWRACHVSPFFISDESIRSLCRLWGKQIREAKCSQSQQVTRLSTWFRLGYRDTQNRGGCVSCLLIYVGCFLLAKIVQNPSVSSSVAPRRLLSSRSSGAISHSGALSRRAGELAAAASGDTARAKGCSPPWQPPLRRGYRPTEGWSIAAGGREQEHERFRRESRKFHSL